MARQHEHLFEAERVPARPGPLVRVVAERLFRGPSGVPQEGDPDVRDVEVVVVFDPVVRADEASGVVVTALFVGDPRVREQQGEYVDVERTGTVRHERGRLTEPTSDLVDVASEERQTGETDQGLDEGEAVAALALQGQGSPRRLGRPGDVAEEHLQVAQRGPDLSLEEDIVLVGDLETLLQEADPMIQRSRREVLDERSVQQRVGEEAPIADLTRDLDRFLVRSQHVLLIALPVHDAAECAQAPGTHGVPALRLRSSEHPFEPRSPLRQTAALLPEPPDGPGDAEAVLDVLGVGISIGTIEDGPRIVELPFEDRQPGGLTLAREERFGLLGQVAEIHRVRSLERVALPFVVAREPVGRILPDRLEHREPKRPVGELGPSNEARVDQLGEAIERVEVVPADRLGLLEGPSAREHRQASEEASLVRTQQLVAPRDRRGQRALAFRKVPGAAGEQREAPVDASCQRIEVEHAQAARSQLQRQRQSVQSLDDLHYGRPVCVGDPQTWAYRRRALHEQFDRLVASPGCIRHAGVGDRQGWNRILLLPGQPQWDPARDEHGEVRRRVEQRPDRRTRLDQLFEVVQHEQEIVVSEVFDHGVGQISTGHRPNPQGPGDLGRHERRIAHRTEIDEEHSVGMTIEPFPGDLEREPGLARAAGTRQREQPGAVQQAVDLHDLGRPADEGRTQRGQVRPPRIERPQRGEAGVEPVDRQIMQMLRAIEILETVLTEVAERDAFGERVHQERPRRFGDHDLSAVARGSDPCRTVDVDPDVVVAAHDTVAAVQTHADADLDAVGPGVGREPSLRRHRCSDGSPRGREHREERVTFGSDLHAISLGDGVPHDRGMLVLERRVRLTEPSEESRRSLDIGEQERHRPGREFGHEACTVTRVCRAIHARSPRVVFIPSRPSSRRRRLRSPSTTGACAQVRPARDRPRSRPHPSPGPHRSPPAPSRGQRR